jgi:hypothetical protein
MDVNGDCTSRNNSLKIFFGPLVRIKLISGGVMIHVDGDAVSSSPEESEGGGDGGMHASKPAGRNVNYCMGSWCSSMWVWWLGGIRST